MYKVNLVIMFIFLSVSMSAKDYIVKASSLKCLDKNGKKYELKHDVMMDLNPSKCLDIPWWPKWAEGNYFKDDYRGEIDLRTNISLKIKDHDISCTLDKGDKLELLKTVKFKLNENVRLQESTWHEGDYSNKSSAETYKDYVSNYSHAETRRLNITLEQDLEYNIINGKIIPSLNAYQNKHFDYYTDPYSKTIKKYVHFDISKPEALLKSIPSPPQLNYVSGLTCGDHQVSQPEKNSESSTDVIKTEENLQREESYGETRSWESNASRQ